MTGDFGGLLEPREAPEPEVDRSPEWHLAEAEEHLLEADVLASSGALAEATARLLAAAANAQIGALKLALRQDALLGLAEEHLRDINRATTDTEHNTRRPR